MLWFVLLLGLASSSQAQAPTPQEKVIEISSWRDCGFISRFSPNLIPPNCLQSVNNVLFDADWSMSRRNGYTVYNSTPCTNQPIKGMWPFYADTGAKYLISFSSGQMFYSAGDGGCTSIPGLAGLSTADEMSCVQSLGYLWCTNGVDPVFKTNVISTAVVSNAPRGTLISAFRNRILISGVVGSQTELYLSGELNGDDWALNLYPNLSTSPAIIDISGVNDGDSVNCLLGQFQNQFLIGRNSDMYALSGYSNQDFALRKISQEIGCIEPKSVQEVNNVLYWLSRRGVESYTGTQITPASYPIEPTINQIISATANNRTFTVKSYQDWAAGNECAAGNGSCLSVNRVPGNLTTSLWTQQTDTQAEWEAGTVDSQLTTTSNPNSVQFSTISTLITNGNFDTYDITNWTCQSTTCGPTNTGCGYNPTDYYESGHLFRAGGYALANINGASQPNDVQILRASDNAVLATPVVCTIGDPGCAGGTIDLVALGLSTQTLRIRFGGHGNCTAVYLLSSPFVGVSSISYVGYRFVDDSPEHMNIGWSGLQQVRVNSYFDSSQSSATATYFSPLYDTGFSTPIGGNFLATISTPTGTNITFAARGCTDALTCKDWTPININDQIPFNDEFWQIMSTFTTQVSTKTPVLSLEYLKATTTGYYISECVQPSTITTWGSFRVDAVENGGSFDFWLSTGNTCNDAINPNATWYPQTENAAITISTSVAYTAARVKINLTSAEQTPKVQDMTWIWRIGTSRPPVASSTYKDRYYLFYTTSTSNTAYNDHVVIYDYNNKWTLFDDINAYSSALYLNKLYTGDSKNSGVIYIQDNGYSDAGGSFNMSFKTPDLDGGAPQEPKSFSRAYLLMSAPNGNASNTNLACNYSLNGSTVTYSLGNVQLSESGEGTGYFVAKLPFPLNQPTLGNWISLSCSYNGSSGPLNIYGLKIVYKPSMWN